MTLLALSLSMSVTACKKKKADDGGTTASGSALAGSDTLAGGGSAMADAGPDTTADAASAGAGTGSDVGGAADAGAGSGAVGGSGAAAGSDERFSKKAGNCPSTVFGSTTKSAVKGKTIVLTITATDKDAIATIQRRAEELLKEKADDTGAGAGGAHDQKGSHGGAQGICPVYWTEGGKATSKKDAKGVVITITPKDKPDDLKKEIDDRITKAADWVKTNVAPADQGNSGGVGGGAGDHGGNHSGSGDSKGKQRKEGGTGGGAGTGGGGGKGTGAGAGTGSAK
ncbi:MAG TPA: hypothetical protein VK427_05910 [Kofleriaceae bacterium]|nr:hypothetical protein [Kofleriaceae bacterium]